MGDSLSGGQPLTFNEWMSFITQTFTSPGNGVFTVHTAEEKKLSVAHALYGTAAMDSVAAWKKSLNHYSTHQGLTLFGIPSDSGGGIQRGANWGPLAIREALYKKEWANVFFDLGDVRVNPHLLQDELLNEATIEHCRKAMYGSKDNALPVSPLTIAEQMLALHHMTFPKKKLILLGGDHSVAYPALKEFLKAKKSQGIRAAVIHFDAHTDLLDERLGIPICFGSWVSHALNLLESPDLWIQLGIRSSGKNKEYWEKNKKIHQYWADEIHDVTAETILKNIIEHLALKQVQELYITFDIDALDGAEASATGTPERNGLSTEESVLMIEELSKHFEISGADVVEVAPFVHHAEFTQPEPSTTLANTLKILHALKRGMFKQS